ncbi:BufA1 family periplasmic bufferin-type metallophore [Arhodomonas sp. SL1]|uniref:BufA1 family periplasmic bufferin-type metallophore n=1 Tax=Arhodomonas sp. SL1 TaxID=3425691 RepID=UPI003F884CDE
MPANRTALLYGILLGAAGATVGAATAMEGPKEKCYGIARAGMNDCATLQNDCAGTVSEGGARHAFVVVPRGTCEQIVGGHPQPPEAEDRVDPATPR